MRALALSLRVLGALAAMLAVLLLPSTAWGSVDCQAAPEDPACQPADPEPTPTPDPEPTPTPDPEPPATDPEPTPPPTEPMVEPTTVEPAPGVDTGVFLDPTTGALRVDENTGVALGVAAWLASVVAGLSTAVLVLP